MSEAVRLRKVLFGEEYLESWEMEDAERIVFYFLLNQVKPKFCLEIGSRNGGSLSVLLKLSQRVTCLDVDETLPHRLGADFESVHFVIGDSAETLPKIILSCGGDHPDFIHIDGNHSAEGARTDLLNSLSIHPSHRVYILMHDTFNPEVRKGIQSIDYSSFGNLVYANIDFMTGVYHTRKPVENEMWGGFSLFTLDPVKPAQPVIIESYLQKQFEIIAHEKQK